METLLQSLANPGDMSGQQWLLVVIMLLIVVGGGWFVLRLYRIIEADRKRRYVPNIGRKRLNMAGNEAQGPEADAQATDAGEEKRSVGGGAGAGTDKRTLRQEPPEEAD